MAKEEKKEKYNQKQFMGGHRTRLLYILNMAINSERQDIDKYTLMHKNTEDEFTGEILKSIILDDARHKSLLKEMFCALSDQVLEENAPVQRLIFNEKNRYAKNILDKTENARMYNELLLIFAGTANSDIIQSIINDEQNHALLNLFLLQKME